ncbi:MAG: hypothetical protein K5686_08480 [Lachnospiraceae bacterium]|nr:hypothetical protein [Lachnospiraceae bacterium]
MEERKPSISDRVTVYLICAMILVFSAAFFMNEKKDFSESENRYLAVLPDFSLKHLSEGKFTEGLEKYVCDHFPERESFLNIVSEAQRLSGRKQIGDIYICDDRTLIQAYGAPANTERIIGQFDKLCDSTENAKIYLMLVPTAVSINAEKLPKGAVLTHSQSDTTERIYSELSGRAECVDAASALAKAKEGGELYYRTDHHWTTYGAYAVYEAYCKAAGLDAVPASEYKTETVTDAFRGTLYSRLNDEYFGSDSIVSYSHPDWQLSVKYEDSGEISDTPYAPEYLDKKDKYSYFLNNIHPLITIENASAPEGAAAVIKDSYANSFVPFMLMHYRTLYVFDTRYYKGGPSSFINEHKDIKDVLILYNMNTLDTDTGIGGIY